MRIETYLNALLAAQREMFYCIEARGRRFGVMVDGDTYALKYQRLDRQARKFEKRLRQRLAATSGEETSP